MKTITADSDPYEIERLNELLKNAGIQITAGDDLALNIDPDVLNRFVRRNAGRPYKPLKENGFLAHVTKGEIRKRMAAETAEEIARTLGISRRTLFRRMKETVHDEDELL